MHVRCPQVVGERTFGVRAVKQKVPDGAESSPEGKEELAVA